MLGAGLIAFSVLAVLSKAQFYGIERPPTAKLVVGATCAQNRTKLQVGTYELSGDCVTSAYCASDGTCKPRACRKDEYPFGYPQGGQFPPMCPQGQFCPDEGDACQPLLPVGSPCQLNRDDQCEPPPNAPDLAVVGRNVDGAVCLNFVCMWANVTATQPCVVENTPYIAYTPDSEFAFVVSRGNCVNGLYCDAPTKTCIPEKAIGVACTADKECETGNCGADDVCAVAADEHKVYPLWMYASAGSAVVCTLLLLGVVLFAIHRRMRDAEMNTRIEYWREQEIIRDEILLVKEGSTTWAYPGSPKSPASLDNASVSSWDSQVPMLRGARTGPDVKTKFYNKY